MALYEGIYNMKMEYLVQLVIHIVLLKLAWSNWVL